jgi:hypothetical protein
MFEKARAQKEWSHPPEGLRSKKGPLHVEIDTDRCALDPTDSSSRTRLAVVTSATRPHHRKAAAKTVAARSALDRNNVPTPNDDDGGGPYSLAVNS